MSNKFRSKFYSSEPKTTLLLTLYSKSPYLASFIKNFLCQPKSRRFILRIADGSSPLEACLNQAICQEQKSSNILYTYHGIDIDYDTYIAKIYSSLKSIITPYVLIACQDDLFNLEALFYHESFLDNNLDFISTRGKTLSLANNKPFPFWGYTHPVIITYFSSHLDPCASDSLSSFNQIFSADGWNNMYSLFRTEALLIVLSRMVRCHIADINAWEYFFHLFLFDIGKSRYLPRLDCSFYLRREGSSTLTSSLDSFAKVETRVLQNEFASTVTSLYLQLSQDFRSHYTLQEVSSAAIDAFSASFRDQSRHLSGLKYFLGPIPFPLFKFLKGFFHGAIRIVTFYRYRHYYSQSLDFHV